MKGKRKILLFSLLAMIVLAATVTLVYAYYIHRSNDLVNEFSPAPSVQPVVGESVGIYMLDGSSTNTAISVGETNYPVYVRAAIVLTWQGREDNGDNEIYFRPPVEGVDYKIAIGENWTENSDGFYYYSLPVSSNGTTTDLISDISILSEGDRYELSVEIIAQTIQAVGSDESGVPAVMDAWGWSRGD